MGEEPEPSLSMGLDDDFFGRGRAVGGAAVVADSSASVSVEEGEVFGVCEKEGKI